MTSSIRRRVVAECSVTIDGFSSGPRGPAEDGWLYKHAMSESSALHYEGIWRGASSVVLGRTNYEGFYAVWPGITADPATDTRTRALGEWLAIVDKGVISSTLSEADWTNSRVFPDPGTAIRTLRSEPGTDILVLNSASVIQALLAEDLIDDLHLTVIPVLLGGGLRLLPDGVQGAWTLESSSTMTDGAVSLHYRRAR